jgi:thioesterase domain-containing protein/acyl carrier protein
VPLETNRTVLAEARQPFLLEGDLEQSLLRWWKELLGIDEVGLDDDFFDLGGHSLIGVQLFNNVKEEFGIDLSLATLFEARTVRQIANLIREARQALVPQNETPKMIVPVQPHGTQVPLFWVPGGFGTNVLMVRELSELLGNDQPFYGFETPEPGPDEEFEPVPARAQRFLKEIKQLQPRGPYRILGFCGGGFIAWEMAVQLESAGDKVSLLGMVESYDIRFPSTFLAKQRYRGERLIWKIRQLLKRGPKGMWSWSTEKLASSTSLQRIAARLTRRSAPAIPAPSPDPLEKVRASLVRYFPASFQGKSYFFLGKDTYQYAGLSRNIDPRLAWRELSKNGSEIAVISGDHEEMLKSPNVQLFASVLRSWLKESDSSLSTLS